jgi:hypothetical protein
MTEEDLQAVDAAIGSIDMALFALKAVDLRPYGGDAEVKQNVKDMRKVLGDARRAGQHLKKLKWRKA